MEVLVKPLDDCMESYCAVCGNIGVKLSARLYDKHTRETNLHMYDSIHFICSENCATVLILCPDEWDKFRGYENGWIKTNQ